MRGHIGEREAVVYWVSAAGSLMLAPDTRMKPFRGWRRVECQTLSEIEQFSRRMALQQYNKMRRESCGEHLRHMKRREDIKANCRLRLASGCFGTRSEPSKPGDRAARGRRDQGDVEWEEAWPSGP